MSGNIFTETDPPDDSSRLYEAGEVQQYLDELSRLQAENERLREALQIISRGKIDDDMARYDICAARLSGVARKALNNDS